MDPRDLPPLRAGLGFPGLLRQGNDAQAAAMMNRMVSVVSVMTQHAGLMAHQLCVHDNRDEVTADDVNNALMHQARHFLDTVDTPEIIEEVDVMQRMLFGATDESTGSSGDSEDTNDTADSGSTMTAADDDTDETLPRTADDKCACAECVSVREAVDTWDAWAPTDEAEAYLRDSVNRAIASTRARLNM
jgi:hypothetical protein